MKLKLITTDIPSRNYELFILDSEEGPILAYKIGSTVIKVKEGAINLIKCSDLVESLSKYFIQDTKFIISTYNPVLYYLVPKDGSNLFNPFSKFVPRLDTISLERGEVNGFSESRFIPGSLDSVKVCDNWYDNIQELETAETSIDNQVKEVFGNNIDLDYSKEFHNSLGEYSSDLINSTVTIELVSSLMYTDSLNINESIIKACNPGDSAKLDITYMYSKGGRIYSGMQTNQAFKYLDSGDLLCINWETRLGGGDIQLEFVSGVLKIYPVSSEVDEAIISDCVMTVGKLSP